jgi:hypothetical protein
MHADAAQMKIGNTAAPALKARGKTRLLTRSQLDGRTSAAKLFDRLVVDIENDLGGHDQLSTIEHALIEGFAGAALTLHHLNTKLALGEPIDLSQHAQAVSAMVRVASRLGISRRAKDIDGSLYEARRLDLAEQRAEAATDEIREDTADGNTLTREALTTAQPHPGDEEA